jgi:hypothetical protein
MASWARAELADLWRSMTDAGLFADTVLAMAATLARHRTHLCSAAPFRRQLKAHLPGTFAELRVPFQCAPASISDRVAALLHDVSDEGISICYSRLR